MKREPRWFDKDYVPPIFEVGDIVESWAYSHLGYMRVEAIYRNKNGYLSIKCGRTTLGHRELRLVEPNPDASLNGWALDFAESTADK